MKTIPLFKVYMSEEAAQKAKDVLMSGYIGQGPIVEEFEKKLKEILNNDFVVTTNSATSAEHLAVHLLKEPVDKWPGIQEGDEALATALTCTATNWPLLANGLKIKWVDVDPNNLNMDLDDLARKITNKTKVMMIVHWGGYPVDLDRLKVIQQQAKEIHGFAPAIIEDCAHSFGSRYKNKPIGSHGNINTFSFQAIKHLTCGDGGALVVPHERLYRQAKLIRWFGIDRESNKKDFRCESDVKSWGYKFHMNDINAQIGLSNLNYVFDDVIKKHRDNANYFNTVLKDVNGVTLLENKSDRVSSSWIYTILVDRQDDFMELMKAHGIMCSRVHERNDIHTCVREYKSILPSLDKVIKRMMCIPAGWWVTEEDREYIYNTIKKGW